MTDQPPKPPAVPWKAQFAVTALLLFGFGVLVIVLMGMADASSETVWQRRVYLFGAVEAVVFTAVGWLFGREVNRGAVETARQDAADARQRATAAHTAAASAMRDAATHRTRAEAVAAVIQNMQPPAEPGRARTAGVDPGPDPAAVVVDVKGVVRSMFGGPVRT